MYLGLKKTQRLYLKKTQFDTNQGKSNLFKNLYKTDGTYMGGKLMGLSYLKD